MKHKQTESKQTDEVLTCSCCGGAAPGPQEPEFDTGYGICAPCVDYIKELLTR